VGCSANAQLEVFNKGRGRAVIVGALKNSAPADALEAWLAERIDVVRLDRHAGSGEFYVDYDDGIALPGRFMRSLRDKIHTLKRIRPEPFNVMPVRSLKGRVRVQVTGIGERELATLTMLAGGLSGVKQTRHFRGGRTMLVEYDPKKVSERFILAALLKSDPSEWAREWHEPTPTRWIAALSGTSTLFACLTHAAPFPLLALAVALNTLRPLGRSITALREGQVSIDLLDVAATLAALATGRPITAAFVIWMVGIGDFLLDVSANNARSALSMLMRHKEPEALRVLTDGRIETVQVGDLQAGDHFMVHTGHGIIADGTVVSGVAEVDTKALTGESRLVPKKAGDPVFASTVVVAGELVVELESSGKNTEAAKIESILNTVGSKPLTLQRDALDIAGKLVLPTFGVAWLAAALSSDVDRAVCVLITDFGTGFRIAVPTSALTAMTVAAREGVLVKGAQYLERLSKTDIIIFDKTGTLTSGVPEVVEVVTAKGMKESALIRWCASAEATHDHPVARALKSCAREHGIPLVEPEP
jgi:Cu2+-exporting ATPase